MTFTILNRKKQFLGYAFDVAGQDSKSACRHGRERQYDLVDHHNSVTILPVDEKGQIYFVTPNSPDRFGDSNSSNCPPAFWSRVKHP